MRKMSDEELRLLTWRYAAMIGVMEPNPAYATKRQVSADRRRWSDDPKVQSDNPVFDFAHGAAWMSEVSGHPQEHCSVILAEEWGD
jgi:hypothetical protein